MDSFKPNLEGFLDEVSTLLSQSSNSQSPHHDSNQYDHYPSEISEPITHIISGVIPSVLAALDSDMDDFVSHLHSGFFQLFNDEEFFHEDLFTMLRPPQR